jgi:hypothetical protein
MLNINKILDTAKELGIKVSENCDVKGFVQRTENGLEKLNIRDMLKAFYTDEELEYMIDNSWECQDINVKLIRPRQVKSRIPLFPIGNTKDGAFLNVC